MGRRLLSHFKAQPLLIRLVLKPQIHLSPGHGDWEGFSSPELRDDGFRVPVTSHSTAPGGSHCGVWSCFLATTGVGQTSRSAIVSLGLTWRSLQTSLSNIRHRTQNSLFESTRRSLQPQLKDIYTLLELCSQEPPSASFMRSWMLMGKGAQHRRLQKLLNPGTWEKPLLY